MIAGRDDEIGRLLGLLALAEAGEPQFVVLHAEPGVGASAVIEHVVAGISPARWAVVRHVPDVIDLEAQLDASRVLLVVDLVDALSDLDVARLRALVESLVADPDVPCPLCVIAVAAMVPAWALPVAEVINVGPLDEMAIGVMVADVVGCRPDSEVVAALIEATGGLPGSVASQIALMVGSDGIVVDGSYATLSKPPIADSDDDVDERLVAGRRLCAAGQWVAAAAALAPAVRGIASTEANPQRLSQIACDAAEAAFMSNDPRLAMEMADVAVDAAGRVIGDEAAALQLRAAVRSGSSRVHLGYGARGADAALGAALEASPESPVAMRVSAHMLMTELSEYGHDGDASARHAHRALELGRTSADPMVRLEAWGAASFRDLLDLDLAALAMMPSAVLDDVDLSLADDALALRWVWVADRVALGLAVSGASGRFAGLAEKVRRVSVAHRFWEKAGENLSYGLALAAATGDSGRLAADIAMAESVMARARSPIAFARLIPRMAMALAVLGDPAAGLDLMDRSARGTPPTSTSALVRAGILHLAGVPVAADLAAPRRPSQVSAVNIDALTLAAVAHPMSSLVGADDWTAIAGTLVEAHAHGLRFGTLWPVSVARAIAWCLHRGGRTADGLGWLSIARSDAAESLAAIESHVVAVDSARFQLALRSDGDRSELHRSLVLAASEAERLGCHGLAAAWRRDLDHLRPRAAGGAAPESRVVVITDLVSSTASNVRVGERRWVELLAEHDAAVTEVIVAHLGRVSDFTGDGLAAWFENATDAVQCAAELHRRITAIDAAHPELSVRIRIGIASGRPRPFIGQLRGTTMARAARVCALAAPGETIVTEDVVDATVLRSLEFEPSATVVLKGFDVSETLYRCSDRPYGGHL